MQLCGMVESTSGGGDASTDSDSPDKNPRVERPEWLREQYHGNRNTIRDIAELCNVSKSTVYRRLREFNIDTDRTCGELKDHDWLRQKYVSEGCDPEEIADQLGVAGSTVRRWMDKHGIERRDPTERVGDKNPNWKGGLVKVECVVCGCGLERIPSRADRFDRFFCSKSCWGEYLSEFNSGQNHNNWKGGKTRDYGELWSSQRRKALERDNYECVICGSDKDELGMRPDVHHIRPVREYDDPNDAHDLINLVTLCRKHHSKWEGLYLRPDPRG